MDLKRLFRSLFRGGRRPVGRSASRFHSPLEVEQLEERCLLDGTPLAATPLPIVGHNPYWTVRELNNYYWAQQGHAHIMFLGDSITDAFASDQGGVYPQSGAVFWNAYIAPLGAVDFGVAGFTTSQVLWQVESGEVAAMTPDVIVLNIGTNNLYNGQSPQDTVTGIATIVGTLRAQLPHTQIIVMGLLPLGAGPDDALRQLVQQTNPMIAQLADGKHVNYLDISAYFLLPDQTWWAPLTTDYIHPTTLGYGFYTIGIWQTVTNSLSAAQQEGVAFNLDQL